MASRDSNLQLVSFPITSTGVIGTYDVDTITSMRVVVEDANIGNTILVKGKIKGQNSYILIETISGNYNDVIHLTAYDILELSCTVYSSSNVNVKLNVSGFNYISGATIDDGTTAVDSTWSSDKISNTITALGDTYVRSTRFETISSGTAGSVTIPPEQQVVLDDFGGTIDAIVTTISSGRPTTFPAQDISGTIIAATFDAGGNWTFTSTPSSYPVAILYRVRQKLSTFDDTEVSLVGFPQYDEVQTVNGKTGNVVLDAEDVGALDAVGNALVDSSTIDFTYDNLLGEIKADVKDESINSDHVYLITPVKIGDNLYSRYNATISTTNNSAATAFILDASNEGTLSVEVRVNNYRTGGTAGNPGDGAAFIRTFRVKTVGLVTTIHDMQSDFTSRDNPLMNVDYLINGTNINFRVKGLMNNNLRWAMDIIVNRNN